MARKLNPAAFNDWVYSRIDDYSTRLEVYYGGAGSGKSYGACQKILLKALNSKRRVLVIRKVGNTLKISIWQLMLDLLSESGHYSSSKLNRAELEITLSNGSVFLFKGLDDPEKMKSVTGITDVVIEEATELNLDDFTQLNLRLRPKEPNPQIYLMFNPVSKASWVYKHFFEHGAPPDCVIVQTNYLDNRFLAPEYIKTLDGLKYSNPAYYRIYALGEFATLDKLVFPVYKERIIPETEINVLPLVVGLDFGYTNDPSAIVWGRYDRENKRIYVCGEYMRKGMLADELARQITNLGLHKEVITADNSRPETIADLKRNGVRRVKSSLKGKDSVIAGIQFILQHELVVDSRCIKFIEELENYTWKKDKSGEYINEPIDTFNHGIDALRYALEDIMHDRRVQVISKKKLGLI